jgi:3-hydroxy-9,10-secoandrosta-1,3,5(10)-triene-9,17-dione monooxygenase
VAGLRGTGSKDLTLENVFVPTEHTVGLAQLTGGNPPGRARNPGPAYRMPLTAVTPYNMVGPIVGIAKGALECFVDGTRERVATFSRQRVAENAPVQLRISTAAAQIDCAELLLQRNLREINAYCAEGKDFDEAFRARLKRDAAFAANLCHAAVDRLAEASGAHGLNDDNPVQMAFRDTQAARSHVAMGWDTNGVFWGRVQLGLPMEDPRG